MRLAWMRRIRRLALWTGGLVSLYAIVGFLLAPPIVRHQLERGLGEQLGRPVSIESVRINPFALSASLRNFSLKDRAGSATAVGFEDLTVNLALSSLFRRGVIVEAVDLTKPFVRIVRFDDGTYSFQDIVERLAGGPPSPPGPPPRFAVYNIQLRDGRIEFIDRPDKAEHQVTDLQVGVPFISSLPAEVDIRVAPRLSAKVNGAPFEIAGETTPFKDRYVTTVRLDFDGLELAKYLGYSPVPLRVRVPSGTLSTRLVLSSTTVPGNRLDTLVLSGTARLERLKVRHADGAPLLALAGLSVDLGALDLLRRHALVTSLRIDAPEVDIARRKDGSIDLLDASPARARTEAPADKSSDKPFTYLVEQVALTQGAVRFVDRTPDKPVALALGELSVYREGLGNVSDRSATVKVRGRFGRAPLELAGKLALPPGGLALDLKADVRDIELAPFSPYSAMYAGYRIEKGRLSLKHAYVVRDRRLTAENDIRLDQFTFGEKVDSPSATTLPVALAVSMLKDENGVIRLNVPLSGALDDPQVSIAEIMSSAFRSPLEKAHRSPFALLGSQFGAGEELAYLDFAAGSAELDAEALRKLKTLATALAGRPGLSLDVSGRADPDADGAEIRRAKPKSTEAELDAALRALAESRARTARGWLVESGKIAAARVSLVGAQASGDGTPALKPARVDFALR
jgi:hypothetical protein